MEKEKRELARQYGMVRSEVSGGEIAEELEKERRSFQLSMCEVSDPVAIFDSTPSCFISLPALSSSFFSPLLSFYFLPLSFFFFNL